MKKITILAASTVIILIVVFSFATKKSPVTKIQQVISNTSASSEFDKTLVVGNTKLKVYVANTDTKRSLGLGERDSIKENEGMFFDFGYKNTYPIFWMKGMRFPLDLIWVNDHVVVEITPNVSNEPGIPDNQLKKYRPTKPVDQVLEVNAGFSDKNKIQVGDNVNFLQ